MKRRAQHTAKTTRMMLAAILAAAIGTACAPATAVDMSASDAVLIEGAKLCTRYLPRHERQYGIPVHLLAAIASTESGRYHRALGMNLPWPWTINVEGKGYFFDTKEEAIAAVKQLQERGIQSIDVGCMQVNLHHHPYAFANLEQAFDPAYNVGYAAQFLKQNFVDEGSWRKAAADYHSRTTLYGEQYARLVMSAWSKIINKVADARAGKPILNVAAAVTPPVHLVDHTNNAAYATLHSLRSYRAPHFHEISVANGTTREHGVLIIRPEHEDAQAQEQASLNDNFVTPTKRSHASDTDAQPASKGPEIVKIRDGHVVGKGQFEPEPHVVRMGSDDAAVASKSNHASPFVFDN